MGDSHDNALAEARLPEPPIGNVPPLEREQAFCRGQEALAMVVGLS